MKNLSLYSDGARAVLATFDPDALLGRFASPGATNTIAADVRTERIGIMDKACQG